MYKELIFFQRAQKFVYNVSSPFREIKMSNQTLIKAQFYIPLVFKRYLIWPVVVSSDQC